MKSPALSGATGGVSRGAVWRVTHFGDALMKPRTLLQAAALAAVLMAPLAAQAQRYGGAVPPPGPYRGGAVTVQGGWSGGGWSGNAWRAPAPGWGWGGGVAWGRPVGWGWGGGWGWGRPVGWGWGWGPAWGWGWGPSWAWGPAWGWGATWGWGSTWTTPVVVAPPATGAWVLPPAAAPTTVFIERTESAPAAPPAPAAQQWWYWCESARAYYPYVQSCAEAWQRVEPRVPSQ
jgi:hypothetical protein